MKLMKMRENYKKKIIAKEIKNEEILFENKLIKDEFEILKENEKIRFEDLTEENKKLRKKLEIDKENFENELNKQIDDFINNYKEKELKNKEDKEKFLEIENKLEELGETLSEREKFYKEKIVEFVDLNQELGLKMNELQIENSELKMKNDKIKRRIKRNKINEKNENESLSPKKIGEIFEEKLSK